MSAREKEREIEKEGERHAVRVTTLRIALARARVMKDDVYIENLRHKTSVLSHKKLVNHNWLFFSHSAVIDRLFLQTKALSLSFTP